MTSTPLPDTEYVSTREAAAYHNVDSQAFWDMRRNGTGPEAISDGYRLWYRKDDIEKLVIRKNTRNLRRPHTEVVFGA
jgi:hypothetical protein